MKVSAQTDTLPEAWYAYGGSIGGTWVDNGNRLLHRLPADGEPKRLIARADPVPDHLDGRGGGDDPLPAMEKTPVEYIELDPHARWAYLRRFYEVASRFHRVEDRVVSEEEVDRCVRSLKRRPAPRIRRRVQLERWRFTLDGRDEGIREGYFGERHREDGWEEVTLPHSLNHVPEDPVRFGTTRYRILAPEPGTSWDIWKGDSATWYKTRVPLEPLGADRVATLAFDSVNLLTDVWVNESPVMMGHLGLFPFAMEVTEELEARTGPEAVIALRVANHATNTPYLFANGAQLAYAHPPFTTHPFPVDTQDEAWSGIAGEARLDIMDRRHLHDVFIRTERIGEGEARLSCRVELRNETWRTFSGSVRVEVGAWLPREREPVEVARSDVSVRPLDDGVVEIGFTIRDPLPWTPETPALSLAHVVLLDEAGAGIDDMYETFGIRTFRMEGSHFFLNGRKIFPRGTHDLSNYPDESLIAPSDRAIVRDILLHKGMNAICSRWPSDMRMHYRRIAEYADQLGYLISWTGYFEMWTVHPEMEMYARRDVPAMVRSLRNHPSIAVWEMGDEPLMEIHPHRRFRWYETVYDLVAAEDRSRPIIPAGFWCNELVDLIERHPDRDLPYEERRRKVLAEYPLFTRELAPWDYHYCPYLATNAMAPTWTYVDSVRRCLGGERATVFTEFGIDGMPDFEKVKEVYGTFRWAGWGLMPVNRRSSDMNYYGRPVGREDWRETQAAQALVLAGIIGRLRAHPEAFAAWYLVTLVDPWTFHWGVVDAAWNPKLAYFVARACYAPVQLSSLHGTTTVDHGDARLAVTASNLGDPIDGAALAVRVVAADDTVVAERSHPGLSIPGNGAVSRVAEIDAGGLPPGMYSVEQRLCDAGGREVAACVELFILR